MKLLFPLLATALFLPAAARADLIWHSFLDGNADAAVGADGVPNGAFQPTDDLFGNPGGALLFDGNYHIDIGNFGTLSAGSISAWVRRDAITTGERGAVAVGATGGGATQYFSFMDQNGSVWRVDLDDGDFRRATTSGGAPTGAWQHIVVTFRADGNLVMYVDGSQTNSTSVTAGAASYTMTFNGMIGGERFDGSRDFIGAIDDVRIYDHELDDVEIFNLGQIGPRFAGVIADSREDWSPTGTQGENGWTYGYYDRRDDVENGNGTYDASDFIPFLNDGSGVVSSDTAIGAWKSSPNHWDGNMWDLLLNPGAGPGPWTNMTQTATHPAANGQADIEIHWPVRRWTADQDYDTIIFEGVVHNTSSGGDGTVLRAFRDGGFFGEWFTDGNAVPFASAGFWNAGQTLDFAIDPDGAGVPDLNSIDDVGDSTQFHSRILDGAVPPVLLEAEAISLTTLRLRYSQPMEELGATDVFNYQVTEGMAFIGTSSVNAIDARTYDLQLDPPLTPGAVAQVEVVFVGNSAGTAIRNGGQSLQFHVPVYTPGLLRRDFYGSIGGVTVPDLTGSPNYPDSPDSTCYTDTFEFNSADEADNYGGRLSGYFVPDISGDHIFYLASDDGGELLLSDGVNPANAVVIATEPQYAGRREWTGDAGGRRTAADPENVSAPIPLNAGERYYIEARLKEGGGGDHLAVAVQKPGASVPANGSAPIGPENLAVLLPPDAYDVTISAQPQDVSVTDNQPYTFELGIDVQLNGLELCPGTMTYVQWRMNGAPIPGATGLSYTGTASLADDGDVFEAVVALPGSPLVSDPATLTVSPDTDPPQLVRAYPDPASPWDRVIVEYDEEVEEFSSQDVFAYEIESKSGDSRLVQYVVPGTDATQVVLGLDPTTLLADGTGYILTVNGVLDLSFIEISQDSQTDFTSHVRSGFGGLTFERYDSIGGVSVTDLTGAGKYPDSPDLVTTLSSFAIPRDVGDNYGARLSGLFYPPVSGDWVFHLRSDDASQLFFNSAGPDPAGKVEILAEAGCCGDFDRYTSAAFPLTTGQGYYIEGLYKEGGGGDFFDVAARLVTDLTPPNDLPPIAGAMLGEGLPTWLCFERYNGIGGVGIDALLNHPKFPNLPDETQFLTRFATPENIGDNFGARVSGLFFPPTTDDWVFYLRSDDASRLYLNPTGTDPNGKVMIADEPDCCDAFADAASAPIRLEAGRGYYIEGIYKEGGGGDFMQVAVRRAGEPAPTDPVLHSLEGTMVGIPSAPAYVLQGDLNRDRQVDISDAKYSLNFLFLGTVPSPVIDLGGPNEDLTVADLNGDMNLDIADGIAELNYLFLGGAPFPAPFPALARPCNDPRPYPAILPDRMGSQLSFDGPTARSGAPGTDIDISVTVMLNPGVATEAWSFGLRPGGGAVVAAAETAGTDAGDGFAGGFEKTQLVDPAQNSGVEGAVSAMILSFAQPVQFELGTPASLLECTLRGTAPAVGVTETWTLDFDANLKGDGEVVRVVTTHDGLSEIPELGTYSVQVTGGLSFPDFIAPFYSGADALATADPECDGVPNVVEWLLGLDPTQPDAHLLPAVDYSGANPRLTLPKASGIVGGNLFVELSTTLQGGSWGSAGVNVITDDAAQLVVEFPPPSFANPQTYIRIGGTVN